MANASSDVVLIQALVATPNYQALMGTERPFNIFTLFTDVFKENAVSRLLAFLLDSRKEHGFRHRVAQAFITAALPNHAICSEIRWEEASIACISEWPTEKQRRLDILVQISCRENRLKFVLGIENKIWAGEQENQLCDYQEAITKRFGEVPSALLFLSPDGHDSVTARNEPRCECVAVSYDVIVNACRRLDKFGSPESALLVDSLARHIEDGYMEKSNKDAKRLICELYGDPKHSAALDKIAELLPECLRECSSSNILFEAVKSALGTAGPLGKCEWDFRLGQGHPHVAVYLPSSGDFQLGYMWHSRDWPIDIGTKFTLRLMAWCNTLTGRQRIEKLIPQKCLAGKDDFVEWYGKKDGKETFKRWYNVWVGQEYSLEDMGKRDVEGLRRILDDAVKRTYGAVKERLGMKQGIRSEN